MNGIFILLCLQIVSQPHQSPRSPAAPPAPFGALPSPAQLRYHRQELSAFISFGLRTFSRAAKDPEVFNPTALDTDQWVLTLRQAGFKRIIFPARHHDGFCLWKTTTTSYSLKSSPAFQETSEKLGQSRDVLEELSKSCTKYDVELGIYLSPWDLNSSLYGHESAYNHYFMSQLTEVLGNRKYGNNGTIAEVWMDCARSFDSVDQKYWWLRWFEAIENVSSNTLIFSPYGSGARWIGAEDGKVGDPCWSKLNSTRQRQHYDATGETDVQALMEGDPHGDIWSIAECDVSITSGWFWRDGRMPKTMDKLTEIYFRSVGRGQPLLLNIPPTPEGVIAQEFVDRVQEFGQAIRGSFQENLIGRATVTASSFRDHNEAYHPGNVLSNSTESYWTMNDEELSGWLEVDFGKSLVFDVISIREHIQLGQRVARFSCEIRSKKHWRILQSGFTIGAKRLLRCYGMCADAVRFSFIECLATPVIENMAVFCVSPGFAMASQFPGELTNIEANRFEKTGVWSDDDDNILTRDAKSTASFAFEGTKAWIVGATDQDSGKMNVYVDNFLTGTVSLQSHVKVRRSLLFQTDDLANCHHLIKIESVTSDPISIHAFYILDNHGRGMFEIEHEKYDVAKGFNVTLRVLRVSGSAGVAGVVIQTLPDTAVQDRDYVDMTANLTFQDGESSRTVLIETINRHHGTGNLTFLAETVDPSDGAVLGLKRSAMITMMELSNRGGGLRRDMAAAQKSDDSLTWFVVLIGCVLCVILAVTVKRKTVDREDEFSLLIPDQRLYVV